MYSESLLRILFFTSIAILWASSLWADDVSDFQIPEIEAEPLQQTKLSESHEDRLHAATLFAQGRLQARRRNFNEALRFYQRAWRYDRSVLSISNELIPLAMGLKRNSEASRYAILAVQDDAQNSESLMRMAIVLTRNSQYAHAIDAYQKILAREDDETLSVPKALISAELGRTAFLAREFELAAKSFDQVSVALEDPQKAGLTPVHLAQLKGSTGSVFLAMLEAYKATEQFQKARLAIEQAHLAVPNKPLTALRTASLLFAEGKHSEALDSLETYFLSKSLEAKADPYRLLIQINQSLVEDKPKAVANSIKQLQEILQQQPANHFAGYTLANLANEAGQPKVALEQYRKFIPIQPMLSGYQGAIDALLAQKTDDVPLTDELTMELGWVLGLVYSRSRSFSSLEAERIERIISDKALLINLARLVSDYAEQDQVPEAASVHLKTFTSHTSAATGLLFALANDYKQSDRFFDLAMKEAPRQSNQFYETWGIQNLMDDRTESAIRIFEQALGDDNVRTKTSIHFLIAGAYLLEDQNQKAIESAKIAAENANNNPRLLSRYPWILYHSGKLEEAEQHYNHLLEKLGSMQGNPTAADIARDARLTLSYLCQRSGKPKQAVEWLEQVLDQNPDDVSALNDLGYLWADRNEHLQRAMRMTSQAVAAEPENSAYRDSLGWAYYRLGKFEQAREELEKARELNDKDGVIYDHLGDTYLKLGNKEQARKMWQHALDLFEAERHPDQIKRVKQKLATG